MGRRAKDNGDNISLFPFMSILVCLIGSLTLMITALMATQTNQEQAPAEVERYQQYTELKAKAESEREALADLQKLIAEGHAARQRLANARKEVEALKGQQSAKIASSSEHAALLAEAAQLRQRLADLEAEPEKLAEEVAKLEAEIKKKNAGPEEAIVQIRPGGTGVDIVPTFVEAAANGIVIHGGPQPVRISNAEVTQEAGEFAKLLDKVAAQSKGQIIFLIRPDGIGTYDQARNFARNHYGPNGYARTGKLPVPTQGNIDLSVFKRS